MVFGCDCGERDCSICRPKLERLTVERSHKSLSEKVAHVKKAKLDKSVNHACHWPGCEVQVPPALWGCKSHWFKLPQNLRSRIWATYRPGQEKDKRPSESYLQVAKEVDKWIRQNHS